MDKKKNQYIPIKYKTTLKNKKLAEFPNISDSSPNDSEAEKPKFIP